MMHVFRLAAIALMLGAAPLVANAQVTPSPTPMQTPMPNPSPSGSPAPVPTPAVAPENPLVTARVTKEFAAWQHGKIARSQYSPYASGTYIDAFVNVVSPDLQIGTPLATTYRSAALLLGDLVYRYDVSGPGGVVSIFYYLNQAGQTDGITFIPQIFRPATATP